MEYRDGMFQAILADYALFEIKKAFFQHIKTSSDLPTPSDIVKLIDEDRKYRFVEQPSISKLLEYKQKGISLTPEQQRMLDAAQSHYQQAGA